MGITKNWEVMSDGDLVDMRNWRALGNNRYAALRLKLLIVRTDGQDSRFGPTIEALTIAPNDTIEVRRKREEVITQTNTITEAIRFSTTSRVNNSLTAKLVSELGAKAPGFSGKIGSELLTKEEYEITNLAETALSATNSHIIQETNEDEHILTLTCGDSVRVAKLRRRYWPRRLDVYLYSCEYLELTYRRSWYWLKVRETMKRTESDVLGWKFGSIVYYEPQRRIDVTYDPIDDELADADSVDVLELHDPMPRTRALELESLETLAKLAFPVTRDERRESAGRRRAGAKRTAAKKSARKVPAKKFARKVAAKKISAKKSTRKATAKKSARRIAPRKRAMR
jgi:hypothetical protein